MGRFADILGTFGTSFGIGPKGARAMLDAGALTAPRTHTLPNASGTLMLDSQLNVPFLLADGTSAPIALTGDGKVPFFLADGTESDISLAA